MKRFRDDIISRFRAVAELEGLSLEIRNDDDEVEDNEPSVIYLWHDDCPDRLATITYGDSVIRMNLPKRNRMLLLVKLLSFANVMGGYSVLVPSRVVE